MIFGAQHAANLPQHLFHAHVRTRVARAVVAREKQLQLFAGLPRMPRPQHPFELVRVRSGRSPTPPEQSPSSAWILRLACGCGSPKSFRRARGRPVAIFISEIVFAAEAQQRVAILRKRRRARGPSPTTARVLSKTVFHTRYGKKHLQQRGEPADLSRPPRQRVHHFRRRLLEAGHEHRAALVPALSQARPSIARNVSEPVPDDRW